MYCTVFVHTQDYRLGDLLTSNLLDTSPSWLLGTHSGGYGGPDAWHRNERTGDLYTPIQGGGTQMSIIIHNRGV